MHKRMIRIGFYIIAIPWLTFAIWFPIVIYNLAEWIGVSHLRTAENGSEFSCVMAFAIFGGLTIECLSIALSWATIWGRMWDNLTEKVATAFTDDPPPAAPKEPRPMDWSK